MNSNINKLLAIVAVALMATTVFGAIASDGTGGSLTSSNEKPEKVSPVSIDSTWTESKEVWEGYPNVTFDIIDGVKTVTFNNANIEFDIDDTTQGTRCISIMVSESRVVLHGNNQIHLKTNAFSTDISVLANRNVGGQVVTVCGNSMRDTLTIAVQSDISATMDQFNVNCIAYNGWAIRDCTINFVLEKELDNSDLDRYFYGIYGNQVSLTGCRIVFSINDGVEKQYNFQGINLTEGSSLTDSVIRMRASDKITNTSPVFNVACSQVTINCCKLDIEMAQGRVFYDSSGANAVTFDDFNQIDFYDTLASEPRIIPGGESYSLTGTDWDVVKILVDSNVKEPTDDTDNGVAVTVAIVASVLLSVFAISVVLIGFRHRP